MDKGVYVNYHLSGKKHKAALKRAAQSKEMGFILPRVTVNESSEIKILHNLAQHYDLKWLLETTEKLLDFSHET